MYKNIGFIIKSKYDFNIVIISIFKLFSNKSISFSENNIKNPSIKALLASIKNKFSSILILFDFFIFISINSVFIFSIYFLNSENIILIISEIPST